ncbi:hypothetical protein FRB90_001295 [Tulasnella sp. 427]|nr:hypothetical protein FRB90_001295 [Tulasnella sp. 427]
MTLFAARGHAGPPQRHRRLNNAKTKDESLTKEHSSKRNRLEEQRTSQPTEPAQKRSRVDHTFPSSSSQQHPNSDEQVDRPSSPLSSPFTNLSSTELPTASPTSSPSQDHQTINSARSASPPDLVGSSYPKETVLANVSFSTPTASSHPNHPQLNRSASRSPSSEIASPLEQAQLHLSESISYDSIDISSQRGFSQPPGGSHSSLSPQDAEPSAIATPEDLQIATAGILPQLTLSPTHEASGLSTSPCSPHNEQSTTADQPAPPPPATTARESTGPYIDTRGMNFGLLVPFNDSGMELPVIPLYLPYNRFGQKTLKVGSSATADIRIQGDGIGPIHCCLNLILRQLSWSSHERTVKVDRSNIGGWVTMVKRTETSEPSVDFSEVLTPGAVVVFGHGPSHKYRYVPPEPEVDFHRLKSNFTWSEELQPASGPQQPDDYCAVYFVRTRDKSKTDVVLKMISTLRPHSVRLAHREREVLQLLDHENTIRLLACQEDIIERTITFVFPRMRGGSLLKFVRGRRVGLSEQVHLSETVAPWAAKGLLSALKFLHARQVVHRNIKPENVFLEDEWSDEHPPRIVLADFALSRLPGEGHFQSFSAGTADWIAPSSFRNRLVADYPIDRWGLGLILWYIVAGMPRPWGYEGLPDAQDTIRLDWSRLFNTLEITRDCSYTLSPRIVCIDIVAQG